jgi:putative endopeptidase
MNQQFKRATALILLAAVAVVIGCGRQVANTDEVLTTNIRDIDPKNFDTTCLPCQDFYQYANGTWIKNNPVPKEYGNWGTFREVYERNNKLLKQILDEVSAGHHAAGSVAQKIGDFYSVGMDTAAINKTGIGPLKADFERINAISSVPELCRVISGYHAEGINMLFDTDAGEDLFNSSMTNVWATQGGLTLPERDYYTRDDSASVKLRDQYVEHMTNMFRLLDDDSTSAADHARAVLALETRLAQASWTRTDLRNYPAWYRVKKLSEVKQLAPNFDWQGHFEALGLPNVETISFGPEQFFTGMNKALTEISLDDWKQYLRWNLITTNAFYVGEEFDKENFRFFGTILGGSQERRERWKRILGPINNFMGEALGQLFVERAFTPETKARALEMVNNLRIALRERLERVDWMSDATRAKALEKLDALKTKIGYPDKWRDYSGLQIGKASFVENARAGRAFDTQYKLSKVGKAPDPTEWVMNPQTVNAGYNPVRNDITFPAGILQPPFFDGEIDDAVNYGAMGMVIGHEMTHGFDDSGRRFDKDGNMADWWTEEDSKRYEERSAKLVEQFNGYYVADSVQVNGALCLGENIADLGGLRLTIRALEIASQGKTDPMIDGFTQRQRLFLSYAQVWRNSTTPEAEKLQVQSDPHPPAQFRVNGPLSNLEEFEAAFGCKEGDRMVRPESERGSVW